VDDVRVEAPAEVDTDLASPAAVAVDGDGDAAGRAAPEPYVPRRHGFGRWGPALATCAAVGAVIVVTLSQLHLGMLLNSGTTTGGDTGAHFMMPAYIRNTLLGGGHLTGWDPAWYSGFPIYTFYFVLPDALVALASFIIPYGLAFKWATLLGSLLLPVCAWACGRFFRLRPPIPAAMAVATLPFLFDPTWTIYGGNLFSTMAGEYSFSLSLSLAILFLGLMALGLRTGKHRAWAAVVLAACILSHIIPAMFAIGGAVILVCFELLPPRLRPTDHGFSLVAGLGAKTTEEHLSPLAALWWGCSTVGAGLLLSGWWLVPFGIDQPYSTSMGYTNVTTYAGLFFPEADLWVIGLAVIGLVVAIVRRSRFGLLFSILAGLSALGLVFDPLGSLYNVRLLPLWFICVYLLAGWVFGVTMIAIARWWRRERLARWVLASRTGRHRARIARPDAARVEPGAIGGALVGALLSVTVVAAPFVVPASALPFGITPGANQVTSWASWNYSGYEGAGKDYAEYHGLMQAMSAIGAQYGCGRAMWEYNSNQDRFGTPEALMLLPYWTGGCIDSMEGLLFESSTTTPYHFLNQAELSVGPSEPVVGLPYGPVDVPLGVEHLQLLGVRYFMAFTPSITKAANADPELKLLARSGPWNTIYSGSPLHTTWSIYLVRNAPLVQALPAEPVVLTNVSPGQHSWLAPSVAWYDDPTRWKVVLAAGGPARWPRVRASDARPPVVRVPTTLVHDIHASQSDGPLSFRVSKVGTPVLVKVSYFPNWKVSGAEGPWRVTPNLMVVVPTSHLVTLSYGATAANRVGELCTAAGVGLLIGLGLVDRRRRRETGTGAGGAAAGHGAGARVPDEDG
jgi:6-pyruvoyl-tetrahydropterin synthase related domain